MAINSFTFNGGAFNDSGGGGGTVEYNLETDVIVSTQVQYQLVAELQVRSRVTADVQLPLIVTQFSQVAPTGQNWKERVVVNGVDFSDTLIEQVVVEAEESSARVATFSAQRDTIPNLNSLVGQPVTINYQNFTNGLVDLDKRIFTGIVDSAEYDPVLGILSFSCTDGFVEEMDRLTQEQVIETVGGFYSTFVFDEDLSGFELAEELIGTQPVSFEKDSNGQLVKSPFLVPGTLDFNFDETEIIDTSLAVSVVDFRTMVNDIDLSIEYRYPRLIQREGDYGWDGTDACKTFFSEKFLTNEAVVSALEGTGGTIRSLNFTPLPANGLVICGADAPDNFFNATDVVRSLTNNGFDATVMRRFDTGIIEDFSINIVAPQSIDSFGSLPREDATSVDIDFDTAAFTNVQNATDTPGDITGAADPTEPPAGILGNGDFFEDKNDEEEYQAAFLALLNQARVDILQSHRENIVSFDILLTPQMELSHYAEVITTRLKATGKVAKFTHTMDITSGEAITSVELKVSRTDSALVVVEDDFDTAPAHPGTDFPAVNPLATVGASETPNSLTGGKPGVAVTIVGATGQPLPDITGLNAFIINRKIPLAPPFFEQEGLQLASIEVSQEDQDDHVFTQEDEYIVDVQNNQLTLGI